MEEGSTGINERCSRGGLEQSCDEAENCGTKQGWNSGGFKGAEVEEGSLELCYLCYLLRFFVTLFLDNKC